MKARPKTRGGSLRVVLVGVLSGLLVVLIVLAIVIPIVLDRATRSRDAQAREMLLTAAARIEECGERAGGSYAGCRAVRMEELAPGLSWRDATARSGDTPVPREGRVGRVIVGELGESMYRLETVSRGGKTFSYDYERGAVTRMASGSEGITGW